MEKYEINEKRNCLPIFAMVWGAACNKKRISNIKQGMSNDEVFSSDISLHHSTFLVRYSVFLRGIWHACFYYLIADSKRIGYTLAEKTTIEVLCISSISRFALKGFRIHEQN
jgi:hypothetical protein